MACWRREGSLGSVVRLIALEHDHQLLFQLANLGLCLREIFFNLFQTLGFDQALFIAKDEKIKRRHGSGCEQENEQPIFHHVTLSPRLSF